MSVRVLLVDDHAMVRAGLSLLIRSQPDMEVAGEAEDGVAAVRLTAETRPDVAVLDISMPGKSGLEIIGNVREACDTCRILMLTMHDDYAYLRAAMEAGSAGYVVKTAADEELITAIRTVHAGRTFFSVSLGGGELAAAESRPVAESNKAPVPELSWREAQVLEFVTYGYTSQQIADHLNLSVKTVDGYRSRVMEKLGLQDRAQLVRYAVRKGIMQPDRLYPRDFRFEDDGEKRTKR